MSNDITVTGILQEINNGMMVCPPNPEDGDIYFFLVRIPSALASASAFISVHYLLNQLMDFDQTCIDTLFGNGKELIRFW